MAIARKTKVAQKPVVTIEPFDTVGLIDGTPVDVIVDITPDKATPGVARLKCQLRMIERA